MGSGKSSIGKVLAKRLSRPFIDLDEYIEAAENQTIPEIFEEKGEAGFRQMELKYLSEIINSQNENIVLALGGGTVTIPECADLLQKNTQCIYLKAEIPTLVENLSSAVESRPILKDAENLQARIEELMSQRAAIYENTAHHIINTDDLSYDQSAEKILDILGNHIAVGSKSSR